MDQNEEYFFVNILLNGCSVGVDSGYYYCELLHNCCQ